MIPLDSLIAQAPRPPSGAWRYWTVWGVFVTRRDDPARPWGVYDGTTGGGTLLATASTWQRAVAYAATVRPGKEG